MARPEALTAVRYVMNARGEKTDVLIPLPAWEALLSSWKRLVEMLEDQEDRAILQEWLKERAEGTAQTTSLDELERELIADGLLPG